MNNKTLPEKKRKISWDFTYFTHPELASKL
jgi:hypothetical protein